MTVVWGMKGLVKPIPLVWRGSNYAPGLKLVETRKCERLHTCMRHLHNDNQDWATNGLKLCIGRAIVMMTRSTQVIVPDGETGYS